TGYAEGAATNDEFIRAAMAPGETFRQAATGHHGRDPGGGRRAGGQHADRGGSPWKTGTTVIRSPGRPMKPSTDSGPSCISRPGTGLTGSTPPCFIPETS